MYTKSIVYNSGNDMATVAATGANGQAAQVGQQQRDELLQFVEGRYISATETNFECGPVRVFWYGRT